MIYPNWGNAATLSHLPPPTTLLWMHLKTVKFREELYIAFLTEIGLLV